MAQSIRHRGPDSSGCWNSEDGFAVLAHRRLAIQDLSSFGYQPMTSVSGRYVIVFNGEIYNFKKLSGELQMLGFVFRGHSDTEIMLAAFEAWGVEPALKKFDGMFAFAVFDTFSSDIWLARDRMGEKPLYYSFVAGRLRFCSELKGMLVGEARRLRLNWNALGSYFRFGYFPVDESPFGEIRKLKPASFIRLRLDDIGEIDDAAALSARESIYWISSSEAISRGSRANSLRVLEETLIDAVVDQSVADVPVGVFLSGGIDSTLVAALLQSNSTRRINTYTIAFSSSEYNEAPFARDIARHLRTEHSEIPVAVDECLDVIERQLGDILDEPFADASLIATYLVCREARKHVTVCLSGDGGDELFGGYNRYLQGGKLSRLRGHVPRAVREVIGLGIGAVPERGYEAFHSFIAGFEHIRGKKSEKGIGQKLHKIARALRAESDRTMYAELLSFWFGSPLNPIHPFPDVQECLVGKYPDGKRFEEAAMSCDLGFYLVADNLFKVDRAAMAASLEVRLPLLERSVVELARSLPLEYKIEGGLSKSILRSVLYRHVPRAMIERPKMGFSLPLGEWLRGGLRGWSEGLLANSAALEEAGLNSNVVNRVWSEHLSGRQDSANALWAVLMYLRWRESFSGFISSD